MRTSWLKPAQRTLGPPGSGRASSRCTVRTEGISSEESRAMQVWTESEKGFQPRRQSAEGMCPALHLLFCHVGGRSPYVLRDGGGIETFISAKVCR